MHEPKRRSQIRIFLGKQVYCAIRRLQWSISKDRIAKGIQKDNLPHLVFAHRTPIYRKLRDVDMWLQKNKEVNLRLAIQSFDGLILSPEETFSFWRILGKPSIWKGYKKGMVLTKGWFRAGTGGGRCQLTNLIFWMVLHSSMTVKERYRHSFDVFPDAGRTLPFGSGATCVWNYRDLQFANLTNEIMQLRLRVQDGFLCGEIRSNRKPLFRYEIIEKNHRMIPGGYAYIRENELYRRTYEKEELIDEAFLFENSAWMMYEPYIEGTKQEKNPAVKSESSET